jgi:hypothetical protein
MVIVITWSCALLQFTLHPTDGYATILSKFYHWSWAKGFRELLEPVDRSEFGVSPATVNAFYLPTKNAISGCSDANRLISLFAFSTGGI